MTSIDPTKASTILRHLRRKLRSGGALKKHERLTEDFLNRATQLNFEDVSTYFWYHTIDLGNGLVTPGMYDYRSTLEAFKFPANMAGMRVLDIGSATGFFAFEFESRGAKVTSVELPSLAHLDRFPNESPEMSLSKMKLLLGNADSPDIKSESDVYEALLDGPFQFCHRVLGSKVARHYSSVYELSPESLGSEGFDLVFVGDVLLHTLYPLKALANAASLCRGTLIIAQDVPKRPSRPVMHYVGGDAPEKEAFFWWLPNRLCLEQMLKKLGFAEVTEVGRNRGYALPTGLAYDRSIIHADR